jgi:hypothetical protein
LEEFKIYLGPQVGRIRVRDLQPAPPSVRACDVICTGMHACVDASPVSPMALLGTGLQPNTVHREGVNPPNRGGLRQFPISPLRFNPRSSDRASVIFVQNPSPEIFHNDFHPTNHPADLSRG